MTDAATSTPCRWDGPKFLVFACLYYSWRLLTPLLTRVRLRTSALEQLVSRRRCLSETAMPKAGTHAAEVGCDAQRVAPGCCGNEPNARTMQH